MAKKALRLIVTDIGDTDGKYVSILNELSSQLSDGYWEGSENEPISDYCYHEYLEFKDVKGLLAIKVDTAVKGRYADKPNMYVEMTNLQVIEAVWKTLKSRFDEAPYAICGRNGFSEKSVKILITRLSLAKEIDTTKIDTAKTSTTKTIPSIDASVNTDMLAKALLNSITDMQNRIKELEEENKVLKSTLAKVKALL